MWWDISEESYHLSLEKEIVNTQERGNGPAQSVSAPYVQGSFKASTRNLLNQCLWFLNRKFPNHSLKSLVGIWKLPLPSCPPWGTRKEVLAGPHWWKRLVQFSPVLLGAAFLQKACYSLGSVITFPTCCCVPALLVHQSSQLLHPKGQGPGETP